jgi:hypothetical protein
MGLDILIGIDISIKARVSIWIQEEFDKWLTGKSRNDIFP